MFIPLPNLSFNLSNYSKACYNKREMVFWKTEKGTKPVLSSLKKLPNKLLSLKNKLRSRVLKHKKRRSKLINLLQRLKLRKKKFKFKTVRLKFKHPSVVLSRMMCNQRKQSQSKNYRLLVHWLNKPKKPWIQLKRRTSKQLNHSQILQEVFLKSSQPLSGYCQASLRKLIRIPKLKNPNSSIGKLLKSLWRIPMLLWLHCSDLSKSSITTKSLPLTLLKSRNHIFQTQVSIQSSLRQNPKPLQVFVHGCWISLSFTTSFKKWDHCVNNCKKLNNNCKSQQSSWTKCKKLLDNWMLNLPS